MAKKPQYEVEDWQTGVETAKTHTDKEKAYAEYSATKLRNAAKREEYRLAKETFLDKILSKLFKSKDKSNPNLSNGKSR